MRSAGLGPAVDEAGQGVGEPGVRVDAVELTGLDQRGDDRPVGAALVAARKERVLAIERDGPDRALDGVAVDLDAAVVEEEHETLSGAALTILSGSTPLGRIRVGGQTKSTSLKLS